MNPTLSLSEGVKQRTKLASLAGTARPSFRRCNCLAGAGMSGVPPGWDATASSCGAALASMRANITVGAASVDEQGLDAATTILHQNPGAFARFRSSIEGGAGTAVDNVNELYALGLPAGLPGGLAALAMEHRPELVQRLERLADKRTKMQSMRSSSAEGSGQLKGRKRGVYDGPQEERCYDCQEDEGEAEGDAEGGGEAGGGGQACVRGGV